MAKSKIELVVSQPNPNCVLEPPTYYDPELQNASNAEASEPERLQRAIAKSRELRAEYRKQLGRLRSRLSHRTHLRLMDERDPLLDSNLLEFMVGDCLGFRNRARRTPCRTPLSTSVRATFLNFQRDILHELRYRHIESVRFNVPVERWFEWGNGVKEIGNLLANEVTAVNDSLMQHKFLFSSGAAITLVFAEMV